MAMVEQIKGIVNDSVKQAIGIEAVANIDTTDIVSLGKAISNFNAFEGFYNALVNRIIKTVYFVRTYKGDTRGILRDEHEFGAFVQKVYYDIPDAVDNAAWAIPDSDGTYKQASPYDVESVIGVKALVYGEQGTWAQEFIRPGEQMKTAFDSWEDMGAFISGIYVTAENGFKLQEEQLTSAAVNTAMAQCLNNTGHARNLLSEYNALTGGDLTAAKCLTDKEFLRFASKEINRTIENMQKMSKIFNVAKYNTFTDRDNMVVEMLSEFATATDMYLSADTFHDELVALPRFSRVPFWQGSGTSFAFADCSKIDVKHSDFVRAEADDDGPQNENGVVTQSGIICFVHDIENVAAYIGARRTWEDYNPRSDVYIHGDTARKGYAVDDHANAIVFYVADAA